MGVDDASRLRLTTARARAKRQVATAEMTHSTCNRVSATMVSPNTTAATAMTIRVDNREHTGPCRGDPLARLRGLGQIWAAYLG